MTDLVNMIDQELRKKAEYVGQYLTPGTDRPTVIALFAEEFRMDAKEAEDELSKRALMITQAMQPAVVPTPKEVKPVDVEARHTDKVAKLPVDLAPLAAQYQAKIARLFKKTGKSTTAIVITYEDAHKRTFRKDHADGSTWVEATVAETQAEVTLPEAAQTALAS